MRKIKVTLILFALIFSILQLNAENQYPNENKLLRSGSLQISVIIKKIISGSTNERIAAIRRCSVRRYKFCLRPILASLKIDKSNPMVNPWSIRLKAARALGQIQSVLAVNDLMESLELEAEAAKNLNEKKKNTIEFAKRERIKQDVFNHELIMASIIYSLGQLKDKRAIEKVRHYIKHDNRYIRKTTTEALGLLKDSSLAGDLSSRLKDEKDGWVKAFILKSLISLKRDRDKEIEQQLYELLKDKNPVVRFHAADAIIELELHESKPWVVDALKHEEERWVRAHLFKAYMMTRFKREGKTYREVVEEKNKNSEGEKKKTASQ